MYRGDEDEASEAENEGFPEAEAAAEEDPENGGERETWFRRMTRTLFGDDDDRVEQVNTAAPPADSDAVSDIDEEAVRTPVNNIEYFPPNFEGLVLGCIDADFCK